MSHACFVSFKKEDAAWKENIVNKLGSERMLGKSLDRWIDSDDLDDVMQVIRDEYMNGTTVTLSLIGQHSSENEGLYGEGRNIQSFIIRELQATLYDQGQPKRWIVGDRASRDGKPSVRPQFHLPKMWKHCLQCEY